MVATVVDGRPGYGTPDSMMPILPFILVFLYLYLYLDVPYVFCSCFLFVLSMFVSSMSSYLFLSRQTCRQTKLWSNLIMSCPFSVSFLLTFCLFMSVSLLIFWRFSHLIFICYGSTAFSVDFIHFLLTMFSSHALLSHLMIIFISNKTCCCCPNFSVGEQSAFQLIVI